MTVSPESLTLVEGGSQSITATVDPEDANVSFASADESVATVDSGGLVMTVGEGGTTITVTAVKEGYTSVLMIKMLSS